MFVVHVLWMQDLFQPVELQAMVVGNENYDWEELEKVSCVTTLSTADCWSATVVERQYCVIIV